MAHFLAGVALGDYEFRLATVPRYPKNDSVGVVNYENGYPAGVLVVIEDRTNGKIGMVLSGGDFMEELEDALDPLFLAGQGCASLSFLLRHSDKIVWHDIFISLEVNRVFVDKAIIVDIDGTVVDTSERLAYVLSKAPLGSHDFYRIFLSGQLFHMDKPLPKARECLLEMAKTNHIIYPQVAGPGPRRIPVSSWRAVASPRGTYILGGAARRSTSRLRKCANWLRASI